MPASPRSPETGPFRGRQAIRLPRLPASQSPSLPDDPDRKPGPPGVRDAPAVGARSMSGDLNRKRGEDHPADPEPDAWRDRRWRGGKARAAALTPERRSEIARKAAVERWCPKLPG